MTDEELKLQHHEELTELARIIGAERQNENWKARFYILAKCCYVIISLLIVALAFVVLYLH